MTPGRLYLFSLLALVLAGILLFSSATALANIVGGLVLCFALLSYLLGLYMARVGRRGEAALGVLQERIAKATGQEISGEFRTYHSAGLEGVPPGELLLFYKTGKGWILVPLLDELSWIEVPGSGVREVRLEADEPGASPNLMVEMETASGRELRLSLASTLQDPAQAGFKDIPDLNALKDALSAQAS